VHAVEYTLDDVVIIFVGLVWISEAVEANSPLTLSVCHLKPGIIALIELSLNIYTVSFAINGLIIRPLSSTFNVFFDFVEFDTSLFVEIFR
jgi:hypothetical protein